MVLHYLDGKAEAEIFLASDASREQIAALRATLADRLKGDKFFAAIHLHQRYAP